MIPLALMACVISLSAGDADLAVPGLERRLTALDGASAMPYFLLGEEVATERPDSAGRTLARRLLVIAHEIDRASPRGESLSRSVYLALASIADREGEREWLFALAGREPESTGRPAVDAAAVLVADALGAARDGEGREVKQALSDPRAEASLDRLAREHPEARALLERAQSESSCPVCHNRRTIKSTEPKPGGGVEEVHLLCAECRGNPGPRYSIDELAQSLAAEGALLGAAYSTWSGQCWLDGAAPLRDPDPAELPAYYSIDATARIWRADPGASDPAEGRWVPRDPPPP